MICRFLGDIHGDYNHYLQSIKGADYSIQMGDLGFEYDWLERNQVDVSKHRFFGGNHDNYSVIKDSPYSLGDFGPITHIPGLSQKVFFVRGAWSIDSKFRTPHFDWWADEELSVKGCQEAFQAYVDYKPEILLSHEGPLHILPMILTDASFAKRMGYDDLYIKTKTNQMIDAMYEVHRPKIHLFGHYHKDFDEEIDGTRYVCLTTDPSFPRFQHHLDLELS